MHGIITILSFSVLSCVINAEWETKQHSSDYVTGLEVNIINATIVIESFPEKSGVNCMYRCSRVSSMRSVYFDANSTKCYCNNDTDTTAIKAENEPNIQYSFVSEKYEIQYNNGEKRLLDGLHGITPSCTDVQPKVKGGNKSIKNQMKNTFISNVLDCNDEWTVFQRRMDGSVDFYRHWTDYVNGFGSPSGEFWLGLESLHQLTKNGSCELHIYLEADLSNPTVSGYARYSSFQIGGANTSYTLYVSGFNGTVGDSLMHQNGMKFSTQDVDNDLTGDNCAVAYSGAWWYKHCHLSNLNGLYLNGTHEQYGKGIEWYSTWGFYYSLIKTEMKIRCN